MKNILIVSDRSNYFPFLGSQLEKNYNVFYIAVCDGDKNIFEQEGKEFIAFEQILENLSHKTTETILDESEIEKALFYDLQHNKFYGKCLNHDLIIKRGIKYSIEINKIIETKKINLVIVQNDLKSFVSIPLAVARKKKIKTLIFEDGFFRPNTVVLDEKGVNFNNSCPREREFYEHLAIDQEKFHNFLNEEKMKISKPKTKFSLSPRHILGLVRHPKRILTIYSGFKLYLNNSFYQRKEIEDYVLLPLQVRTDSQILCHSSIKDMRDLVAVCISALAKYNQRAKKQLALVIKEHPMDRCLIELQSVLKRRGVKVIFLSQADTRKLIKGSSLVITINSTVGIESLLYYKPVITLGKAFYNIDGIVYHSDNFNNLDTLIENALSTPVNRDLINRFLYYLKFHYQVDGDLDYPDEKNILPVMTRINKVLKR